MIRRASMPDLERRLAARWTIRGIMPAIAATVGLYALAPLLERVVNTAEPEVGTRPVEVVPHELVVPPPPSRPPRSERARTERPLPRPELAPALRPPPLPRPELASLTPLISAGAADIPMNFVLNDAADQGFSTSLVFEIGDLDEPPRAIARPSPFYPPHARARQLEGFVLLEFEVTAEGGPEGVRVVVSEPEGVFEQAAVRAVERWRFSPGVKEGLPVRVRVRQHIHFNLE